jgi:SOS response regulatory protein OraA/RecX
MLLCSQISGTSSQSRNKKSQSVTQSVAALLESFREFKRRDFQPNVKALQNLMGMGFPEEDICDALRVTGNNQSAAVRIVSYSYM